MEMGHLSWPMTHVTHHTVDPWLTWPMTHDPRRLHYFILRMGQGGGVAWWYWTTISVFRAKKSYINKPPAVKNRTKWVSEQLLNVNQEQKMQATAQLFHYHGSMGHWHWPMTMTHWPISISRSYHRNLAFGLLVESHSLSHSLTIGLQ